MALQAGSRNIRPVWISGCFVALHYRGAAPAAARTAAPRTGAGEGELMSTAVDRFDDKARDAFDKIGQNEVYVGELLRHRVYTRFLHWMVALFFFLALFSGFGIYLPWLFRWFTPIFGGGPLARAMHPWFGLGFVIFFGLQLLNWIVPMTWTAADTHWMRNIKNEVSGKEKMEPPDTGFFNGGQKLMFWEIVAGSAVYLVTG